MNALPGRPEAPLWRISVGPTTFSSLRCAGDGLFRKLWAARKATFTPRYDTQKDVIAGVLDELDEAYELFSQARFRRRLRLRRQARQVDAHGQCLRAEGADVLCGEGCGDRRCRPVRPGLRARQTAASNTRTISSWSTLRAPIRCIRSTSIPSSVCTCWFPRRLWRCSKSMRTVGCLLRRTGPDAAFGRRGCIRGL